MVNIVAVLIRAQTARQLTQQILLAQQLEEADEVGVGSLERLVQQGAALFFGNAGRREQTQVLRLGFDAVYRGAQLLQKLVGQIFLCRQLIQAAAVALCKLGHEASPTFLINSSIRA